MWNKFKVVFEFFFGNQNSFKQECLRNSSHTCSVMSWELPNSFSWGPVVLIGKGHPPTLSPESGRHLVSWRPMTWPAGVQEQHWVYGGDTSASTSIRLCACVKEKEKGLRLRAFSPVNMAVRRPKAGAVEAQGVMSQPRQVAVLPRLMDSVQDGALSKLWNTLYVQGIILNNMTRRRRRQRNWTVRNLPESSW